MTQEPGETPDGNTDPSPVEQSVWTALHQVIDPELGINIVDLGLVYHVNVEDGVAHIRMTLTTPGCPLHAHISDAVGQVLGGIPTVERARVELVWDPRWNPTMITDEGREALGWSPA